MIVRCGRCRTQFQVPGEGRFNCPACGAPNEVRSAPGPVVDPGSPGPLGPPPAPPAPDPPSPRTVCPSCSFSFIVGDIEVARCPNCQAEVVMGEDA